MTWTFYFRDACVGRSWNIHAVAHNTTQNHFPLIISIILQRRKRLLTIEHMTRYPSIVLKYKIIFVFIHVSVPGLASIQRTPTSPQHNLFMSVFENMFVFVQIKFKTLNSANDKTTVLCTEFNSRARERETFVIYYYYLLFTNIIVSLCGTSTDARVFATNTSVFANRTQRYPYDAHESPEYVESRLCVSIADDTKKKPRDSSWTHRHKNRLWNALCDVVHCLLSYKLKFNNWMRQTDCPFRYLL